VELPYRGRTIKWNNYNMDRFTANSSLSKRSQYVYSGGIYSKVHSSYKNTLLLQNKLVAKIRGHSFDLGVAINELPQSVNLIATNVKSIGQALQHTRHGRFGDAVRMLGTQFDMNENFLAQMVKGGSHGKSGLTTAEYHHYARQKGDKNIDKAKILSTRDLANKWLELRYGWEPLLNDVYEAAKLLEAYGAPARREVIRVSKTYSGSGIETSASPSLYKVPAVFKVRQYIYYELMEDIPSMRTMDLINPAEIVWESIPYSFVIDWFTPIGTFLDNITCIPKLKGRSMTTIISRGIARSLSNSDYWYEGSMCTAEEIHMERQVSLSGVPLAYPQIKSVDQALSPRHIYNAMALARAKISD